MHTQWNELGGVNSLQANGQINSICSDVEGNIYAAGHFNNSTSFPNIQGCPFAMW